MGAEERADCRRYNLSGKQLAYLVGGDTGTRNGKNLQVDVEETATELDLRLQYLFEDVSRFYAEGCLDDETWEDGWEQLTDIDRSDDLYNPPIAIRGAMPDEMDYIKPAIHFGHVCRLLYSAQAPEFDDEKIAFGFLLGLTGGWLKDDFAAKSSIQKFVDGIPESDLQTEYFDMPSDKTFQDLQDLLGEVEESMEKAAVTTDAEDYLRERLEGSELTLTPPLFKHSRDEFEGLGLPEIPAVIDRVVAEIESDPDLQTAETVAEHVKQDIADLIEAGWRTEDAIESFWAIYTTYTDGNSEKIEVSADLLNNVDASSQHVAKFVKDLSGREPPWDDRPVIENGQFEIKPTQYGLLIGQLLAAEEEEDLDYTIPSDEEIASTCHAPVLGQADSDQQELVEAVFSELGLSE
ncbi:hypothetical protein ACLI4Y_13030 [Natrialbaceae archaeon A-CW3]